MYITKMTHFLDETGNIPEELPDEAKEFAVFLTSIVEAATNEYPEYVCCTDIDCRKCDSSIITELRDEDKEILWGCGDCDFEGTISEWQGTKWDHRDKWNL
jgi:hypothetical protein